MPLIVMTGIPCSGKTTRSQELKKFFEEQGKEVHIISEYDQIIKAGFEKNAFYADANKEKHIRGLLKSEMLKLITANNVVIFDALNYIKGYRYELFCGTKSNRCTQCTVHTEINREQAWQFNENRENEEKYTREMFDALTMRYEDPHCNSRWDSPLFTTYPEATLDTSAIYSSLFKKKAPKPNQSTQNPPLSSTNFLYDLDRITKGITDELINAKKSGKEGPIITPGGKEIHIDISEVTIPQIMLLRRQYITYSKMHTPDVEKIPDLFVQYLNTSLKQ
ncbi:protein KTI12 homolog [Anthonomus grandis grandis]|uniref:protein KTI12 homolog n=1 Tax=Anthonomus grandis grandis TaxID=2921223 RepID=UPI0021651282|nr:protein KTI12 homolog [Anthonomus grandis grandis]